VLKEVVGRTPPRICHYRLFYQILQADRTRAADVAQIVAAATRLKEWTTMSWPAPITANVPAEQNATCPTGAAPCVRLSCQGNDVYRRHHIDKLVKMVVKPAD
jgi:hypothetical protein